MPIESPLQPTKVATSDLPGAFVAAKPLPNPPPTIHPNNLLLNLQCSSLGIVLRHLGVYSAHPPSPPAIVGGCRHWWLCLQLLPSCICIDHNIISVYCSSINYALFDRFKKLGTARRTFEMLGTRTRFNQDTYIVSYPSIFYLNRSIVDYMIVSRNHQFKMQISN